MNMDHALNIGTGFIKPGMDENFLRCFQAIIAGDLLALEIDSDDIAGTDEAQAGFLRTAGLDQHSILTRHARAHMTAWLFGQIEFSEHPARLRDKLAQPGNITHILFAFGKINQRR
jgi:hypothetical protein